jgi:signal recognition particle receptor subunit beta
MPTINRQTREIGCKVVYYGPGLGGKTTNLQHIHGHTRATARGKLVSLATETDRTLYFDFLPLELGQVQGFKVRLHLYTVPGQSFYEASRKLILRGADGVVFVADSQEERLEANLESLRSLEKNLSFHGLTQARFPYVLQLNKRDLKGALPVSRLKRRLQRRREPVFEAVATRGVGVFETLREVARLVLQGLKR